MGHPIVEVRALFSRELMSPEISEDEESHNDEPKSEETYFVPFIPWRSNEVLFYLFKLLTKNMNVNTTIQLY